MRPSRRFSCAHHLMQSVEVHLPECVAASAHPDAWVLSEWLVNPGSKVRHRQFLALIRCTADGTIAHVIAPRSGTIQTLRVHPGESLHPQPGRHIALVEYCPHPVIFKGICAICGDDTDFLHSSESPPVRLPVAYNSSALSVSHAEAQVTATVLAKTLLHARKLSLVLDLDHTLVHATDDPRAAAILHCSPPEANLSSVGNIKLPSMRSPMHIKLRPYLAQFLARASSKFQLHIYTMGSRQYADKVANLIDPNKTFFHGRITSRDDFSEGSFNQKSIRRLFPCDDSMAVIVDDREDVWISARRLEYMPNLVRAAPYLFWNGLHEVYLRNPLVLQNIPKERRVKSDGLEVNLNVCDEESRILTAHNGPRNTPSNPMGNGPTPVLRRGPRRKRQVRRGDKQAPADQGPGLKPSPKNPTNGVVASEIIQDQKARALRRESQTLVRQIIDDCVDSATIGLNCRSPTNATDLAQTESKVNDAGFGDPSFASQKAASVSNLINDTNPKNKTSNGKTECKSSSTKSLGDGSIQPTDRNSFVKMFPSDVKATVASWWMAESTSESSKHLLRLIEILEECHQRFFTMYDSRNGNSSGDNDMSTDSAILEYLRGGPRADVKSVLASMRMEVLKGCSISFTGVIPTGLNGMISPVWNVATRLGAECLTEFVPGRTTHLLVTETESGRTRKFQEAMRSGSVYVVTIEWLEDCVLNFERRPEFGYQLIWTRDARNIQCETADEYKHRVETCFQNEAARQKRTPSESDEIPRTPKRRRVEHSQNEELLKTNGDCKISATENFSSDGAVHVLEGEELDQAIQSLFDDD